MGYYPPRVDKLFSRAEFCGPVDGANAAGIGASFECGAFISISLCIDDRSGTIAAAGYRTNGCGFMVAAAEVLINLLYEKELRSLGGMHAAGMLQAVEKELGKLPDGRKHCAAVVIESLKSALADHRSRRLEEFQGEKAVICTCFGVSEETIAELIVENQLTDVNEVSEIVRAGSGCGACRLLIQEMLDVSSLPSQKA
jgi:NifU-like protein